jgi:hypothetical protein
VNGVSWQTLQNLQRNGARRMATLAPVAVPVQLAGAGFMPAGVGDAGLFGLNKRGNLNLRGFGDGSGVGAGFAGGPAVVSLR